MQILKKDVNNLAELQRRKLELKTKLAQEKAEIMATVQLLREDMKPANLIKHAIGSFLGLDDKKEEGEGGGGKIAGALRMPLSILTDVLIGNRRLNFLVKTLTPMALDAGPKLVQKAGNAVRSGAVYAKLRKGVSGLRKRLRKKSMNKDDHAVQNDDLLFV